MELVFIARRCVCARGRAPFRFRLRFLQFYNFTRRCVFAEMPARTVPSTRSCRRAESGGCRRPLCTLLLWVLVLAVVNRVYAAAHFGSCW